MRGLFILLTVCVFRIQAYEVPTLLPFSQTLFEIDTPIGELIVFRPNLEEMRYTAPAAKAIFVEAFATTYTEYHRQSGSTDSIEKWLCLRSGLTLHSWLNGVFDEEFEEYLAGSKVFLYLCDSHGNLLGWLSHTPISAKGEVYLSQCSLEAASRNRKVATALFEKTFQEDLIRQLFPDVQEIKLITRKINTIAQHLYLKVGFVMDEAIDPAIYGDSYDDRYIGFRLRLENRRITDAN